jgi:hypothetical protein
MLDENSIKLKFSSEEFLDKISGNFTSFQKEEFNKKINNPRLNILSLIQQNIKVNGEFYIPLDIRQL